MTAKTMQVTAKCSDLFTATLHDGNGAMVGSYDGYVPAFFSNKGVRHYGDCVEIEVDLATGQIVGWVAPTAKDLAIFKQD